MRTVSQFFRKAKSSIFLLIFIMFLGHAGINQSLSQSTTYSGGDIGVKWYLATLVDGIFDPGSCLRSLTITLPTDEDYYTVTSFDVEYQMVARNGASIGSQRSKIKCRFSNLSTYTAEQYHRLTGYEDRSLHHFSGRGKFAKRCL